LLTVSAPVIFAATVEFTADKVTPPVLPDASIVKVVPAVVLLAAKLVIVMALLPVIFKVCKSVAVNVVSVVVPTADDVLRLIVSSSLAVTAVVVALPNNVTVKLLVVVSTNRAKVLVFAAIVVANVVTPAPTLVNAEVPAT
jgi:hypothetical protein